MKSIEEVLGSLQLLLPFDFDLQEVFESYLTAEHKGFLSLLPLAFNRFHLPQRKPQSALAHRRSKPFSRLRYQ